MVLGCLHLFYYCRHYFSWIIFYLVLFFIKWLYNVLLNFLFCKYISSHPLELTSIAYTSNIRHFLHEICIHFTLDNVFFYLCYFTFLASLMAFSVPWKCRDCKFMGISSLYSSLWLSCYPVAKMPKVQWDRDRNMDTIMEIYVSHGQPLLICSEN